MWGVTDMQPMTGSLRGTQQAASLAWWGLSGFACVRPVSWQDGGVAGRLGSAGLLSMWSPH